MGSWEYHSEVLTDQSPEEICTSLIREKLLEYLPQEVPYAVTQVFPKDSKRHCQPVFFLRSEDIVSTGWHSSAVHTQPRDTETLLKSKNLADLQYSGPPEGELKLTVRLAASNRVHRRLGDWEEAGSLQSGCCRSQSRFLS